MRSFKLLAAAVIVPAAFAVSSPVFAAGPCGVSPTQDCQNDVKEVQQEFKSDLRDLKQERKEALQDADSKGEKKAIKLAYKQEKLDLIQDRNAALKKIAKKND